MGIDAGMFARTFHPITTDEVKIWSWQIANSLGAENFYVDKLGDWYGGPYGALQIISAWYQDPDIYPEENETFIQVHLLTRFYGLGYERGDLLLICACAEWLEQNIPGCQVWYGGDSSGVLAEPFGEQERRELKNLLYSPKGRDYFLKKNTFIKDDLIAPDTSYCPLCIPGQSPSRYGYGSKYAAYICHGCGDKFITHDGGEIWQVGRNILET